MTKQVLQTIEVDRILCQEQVRRIFDPESLTGLAQSLREVGLLQPIRVHPHGNDFVIIDGERRFRAAQSLGWKQIDCVVHTHEYVPTEITRHQLIANCQREDLQPLEVARSIAALMEEANWSASKTAAKLGFSASKVTRLLRLLDLPEDLQKQIAAGEISATAGYQLSRVSDVQRQSELAAEVASGKLTRDGVTTQVRRDRRKNGSTNSASPARVTAQLGGGRSITLSGPGLTGIEVALEWLGELVGRARKARTQNLELATFIRTLRDRSKGAADA